MIEWRNLVLGWAKQNNTKEENKTKQIKGVGEIKRGKKTGEETEHVEYCAAII